MSRLDELIEKLCPDGVEYFKVETICNISRGRVMSKNYLRNNKGEYPVYSSQTENDGRLGKISTYDFDGEYLTWTTDGAHAGSVFYRYGKFSITNICGLLEIKEKSKILVKYIYYILKLYAKKYVNKGMGNPKLMSNVMGSIKIPIPPLEIQEEIVHILDSFTKVTSEITEKLETELIARRKQYEFYRDSLLTFGDDIERVKLKDVCVDFIVPMRDKPKKFDGNIPWCRIEDINGKYLDDSKSEQYVSMETVNEMNLKIFPTGTVICACSASIGTYTINTRPLITNQTFIGIVTGELLKNSYFRYGNTN